MKKDSRQPPVQSRGTALAAGLAAALLGLSGSWSGAVAQSASPDSETASLWPLAQRQAAIHRYSTLFTAQDVRDALSTDAGLERAIDWCRRTGVTKAYVEEFRDGYEAERAALLKAKQRLQQAGLQVSGCITTTAVGKPSTRSRNTIACYTDRPTQEHLQAIFEYAASLFDEIMIDDFWFTDCTCAACDAARRARTVTIGARTFPVAGDSWADYRGELMTRLSQLRLLAAAKKINPQVRLIIKYPQWYDRFHERGYAVRRETAAFDRIWVGTEVRDYQDRHWGGTVPYEGYFIMRWLGGIGDAKCGGGWYDWLGTTEATYLEQARQTILAGARESMLFCYGGLQGGTGPKDVAALRANLPELLAVADQVHRHRAVGLAAYKPADSPPEEEPYVFDFVGMLGLPLLPCHDFPARAPAAFFSVHALKDARFEAELRRFIGSGRPVLLTDGLVRRLGDRVNVGAANVRVLRVNGHPKSLLDLPQAELDNLRGPFLSVWKTQFRAPNKVGLYLFDDGSWVVENFNDQPVSVELNHRAMPVAGRGWTYAWHGTSDRGPATTAPSR